MSQWDDWTCYGHLLLFSAKTINLSQKQSTNYSVIKINISCIPAIKYGQKKDYLGQQ